VRPVTILFLMMGNVVATQAFADDNSPQPLTRADCTKAAIGWSWNDNANVCESSSQKADGVPKSQPLTRNECNVAGVWWNDRANVCGEKLEAATQADSKTTNPVASTIVINIDKTKQENDGLRGWGGTIPLAGVDGAGRIFYSVRDLHAHFHE
jgi:hypothetical protein